MHLPCVVEMFRWLLSYEDQNLIDQGLNAEALHEPLLLPFWQQIFPDLHQEAFGFLLEVYPKYPGIPLQLKDHRSSALCLHVCLN